MIDKLAVNLPAQLKYEGQTVYLHILKGKRKDKSEFWDIRYRYSLALTMQPKIKSLQVQDDSLVKAMEIMAFILKERGENG